MKKVCKCFFAYLLQTNAYLVVAKLVRWRQPLAPQRIWKNYIFYLKRIINQKLLLLSSISSFKNLFIKNYFRETYFGEPRTSR